MKTIVSLKQLITIDAINLSPCPNQLFCKPRSGALPLCSFAAIPLRPDSINRGPGAASTLQIWAEFLVEPYDAVRNFG